jgi:hypothetical protein
VVHSFSQGGFSCSCSSGCFSGTFSQGGFSCSCSSGFLAVHSAKACLVVHVVHAVLVERQYGTVYGSIDHKKYVGQKTVWCSLWIDRSQTMHGTEDNMVQIP